MFNCVVLFFESKKEKVLLSVKNYEKRKASCLDFPSQKVIHPLGAISCERRTIVIKLEVNYQLLSYIIYLFSKSLPISSFFS